LQTRESLICSLDLFYRGRALDPKNLIIIHHALLLTRPPRLKFFRRVSTKPFMSKNSCRRSRWLGIMSPIIELSGILRITVTVIFSCNWFFYSIRTGI
jgi:hypothetical protein